MAMTPRPILAANEKDNVGAGQFTGVSSKNPRKNIYTPPP